MLPGTVHSSSFSRLAAATLFLACLAPSAAPQKALEAPDPPPAVVGVGMPLALQPDLRQSYETATGRIWGELVTVKGASFLKAHLVDVNLRAGDVLVLRSRTGKVVEEIRGRGPKERGNFWALSAFGDELLLELTFAEPYDRVPFRIDQVVVGDPGVLGSSADPESICSPGDFEDVICYQGDPGKWNNVLASVGVMSVGGNPVTALFCSGSNVSPANYVLTNDHCVTSQAECDSTEFVFEYYRTACNVGAPATTDWESFRCDQLVARSPVGPCDPTPSELDYTLFTVIGDPAATFGYVSPDPTPLVDGEDIYIVQHPAGRPHEITHGGGVNVDVDGNTLRYYDTLDTEGGSSGSPIFRESDDQLVGLHHCGGCDTPGVGNRGMLMSDIYPEIETFLCTSFVDVRAGGSPVLTQVLGNGNPVLEPGEVWKLRPQLRNLACSETALDVQADVRLAPSSTALVELLQPSVSFGDIPASTTAVATAPILFRVRPDTPCGATVVFDLVNIRAAGAGPFPDALAIVSWPVGDEPFFTAYMDDFAAGQGAWTIVDGGSAVSGPAQTWTTANPGGRVLALTAPTFIVDSDEYGVGNLMDEELVSPAIDCSGYESVQLQFTHDFNWYSGGQDEKGDVEVRSSLTGGAWVTVVRFSGGDASGTATYDISTRAAGAADVQVRFRYHDAVYEWWWAVDDVFLLGSNGFVCDVFRPKTLGGLQPRDR